MAHEFYRVKTLDGTEHYLALASAFQKDSKTTFWQLLGEMSKKQVIVQIHHFQRNFVLFPGNETLRIEVEIK